MLRPAATATRLRSSAVIAFVALALAAGGCAQSSSSGNGNAGGGNTKGGGRQDVAALQGRWEQLPDDPGASATPRQRVVKEVTGNRETVTTYAADGKIIQSRSTSFALSRNGPVRVFTIGSGGSDSGGAAAPKALRTYVYRVRGDEFHEVWGLLPGQEEREVVVKRWKRARAGP